MKIKTKLILSLCVAVAIVVFLISFVNNKMSHELISKRIYSKEAPAIAAAIVEKFEKEISKSYSVARMIADNPMVHAYILSGEPDQNLDSLARFLDVAKKQGIDFSFMVSDNSKKYYTASGVLKTIDMADPKEGWYVDAIGSGNKESISIDPSKEGSGLMAFINILMGNPQKPLGIAGVGISLDNLSLQLSQIKLSPNGVTYLIGKNGEIQAHPDGKILREIQNIRRMANGEYTDKVVPGLLNSAEGFLEYVDANGDETVVIFREIPSVGWKVVIEAKTRELGKELNKIRNISFGILIGSILLLILILNILTNAIFKPVQSTVSALKEISRGDMTRRIDIVSNNEMGQLAYHFNIFMDRTHEMITKIIDSAQNVNQTSSDVVGISQILTDASTNTLSHASQASDSCRNAQSNMEDVSQSVETISLNINELSAAADGMSETLKGIVANTAQTNQSTIQAVDVAKTASINVAELGKSARDIVHVVDTITDISEQINLLALNATIEAARAGEAGKGFAVVANEIKELANQTNQATEDIKQRTETIRNSTRQTSNSMEELSSIIQEANSMVTAIASAAEGQMAATQEIANNVQEISSSVDAAHTNVNNSVDDAGMAVDSTRKIIQDTQAIFKEGETLKQSALVLHESSMELNKLVEYFTI